MQSPHVRVDDPFQHLVSGASGAGVMESSEIRWFAATALPEAFIRWFTAAAHAGVVESRCDSYQLAASPSIGIKRRWQDILEIKVRRSFGPCIPLVEGVSGCIESWSKWRPAEAPGVSQGTSLPWVEVHKTVMTRSFQYESGTARPVAVPQLPLPSCDVELASLRIGSLDAWTFAFEAHGPPSQHVAAISAAMDAVAADTPYPPGFVDSLDDNAGYPEWLLAMFGTRTT